MVVSCGFIVVSTRFMPPKTRATRNAATPPPAGVPRVLYLAVALDLFSVALVVPNLVYRWRELGITPERLGAVSSVYSASQIVGGLVIGHLGDRALGRKRALLLSIVGAGVSYLIVGVASSLELLILSRVLVGLVKQTTTCCTALITQLSDEAGRVSALGRLSSVTTGAFLFGQSAGGKIASVYGRRAPCYLAAAIFVVDFALVQLCLPSPPPPPKLAADATASVSKPRLRLEGFRSAFAGPAGPTLLFRLAYAFLMRSTYSLHGLYEQQRWELEPASTGYLASYKQALSLLIEAFLVGALARRMREASLLRCALALSAANAAFERAHSRVELYTAINLPLAAFAGAVTRTTAGSLFSKAVPTRDAGSALSALDVLLAASNVLAPLYGGQLLGKLGVEAQPAIATAHYLALLALAQLTLCGGAEKRGARPKAE